MARPDDRKPKLVPLPVPWQVSPSTPCLRLVESESASDTELHFVGYFGLQEATEGFEGTKGRAVVMVVDDPHAAPLGPANGPYQLVKITFEIGIAARMTPSHDDREVIASEAFDFGALPDAELGQNPKAWVEQFRQRWTSTGLCPDPRAYEIVNSQWLLEADGEKSRLHHYIFLGHDAFAEILARAWRWESRGTLSGW